MPELARSSTCKVKAPEDQTAARGAAGSPSCWVKVQAATSVTKLDFIALPDGKKKVKLKPLLSDFITE